MHNIKSPTWLTTLKKLGIKTDKLNFKELKAFKDADIFLNAPVEGPNEWQYLIKSFKLLTAFSLLTIYENKLKALSTCWDELDSLFVNKEIFKDGLFVQSWVFCDFPLNHRNETILDLFEKFVEDANMLDTYTVFIDCMRKSRLGLYQETFSSKKNINFKELFTNKIIKAQNSVPDFEKGEIFLTRLVKIKGKIYLFGDPKCWPKEFKLQLIDMVKAKLFYFNSDSTEEKYKLFMKYSGPYWMSCVVTDESCPILQPDRYLDYLQ